jgi:hypothetical protein
MKRKSQLERGGTHIGLAGHSNRGAWPPPLCMRAICAAYIKPPSLNISEFNGRRENTSIEELLSSPEIRMLPVRISPPNAATFPKSFTNLRRVLLAIPDSKKLALVCFSRRNISKKITNNEKYIGLFPVFRKTH